MAKPITQAGDKEGLASVFNSAHNKRSSQGIFSSSDKGALSLSTEEASVYLVMMIKKIKYLVKAPIILLSKTNNILR